MTGVLRANHELAFSYRRSVGGADRYFLSGLARAEIWGSRDAVGRVTVPPVDWDPETGAPVEEFVRVGDHGRGPILDLGVPNPNPDIPSTGHSPGRWSSSTAPIRPSFTPSTSPRRAKCTRG